MAYVRVLGSDTLHLIYLEYDFVSFTTIFEILGNLNLFLLSCAGKARTMDVKDQCLNLLQQLSTSLNDSWQPGKCGHTMLPFTVEHSGQLVGAWPPVASDMWHTCWLHMAATCLPNGGVPGITPMAVWAHQIPLDGRMSSTLILHLGNGRT
ncbi:hypothetical protein B0H17DRAFT_1151455 [Mycena rosella]|uniref:Uncharacterized protein n=1 Tax=Mycena rosella TaxID=1033263 RepID=A0AAD7BL08_MYCRO|nr:hypothetical protein B0H17DRAFT_1151455 [Mycena rosella]